MTRTENLSHPAVELKLPLDGTRHQQVIPTETTLFFWGAIAPGTHARLAPADTSRGYEQMRVEERVWEQVSWSLSVDGEEVPLVSDSTYRNSGYRGLAWWVAQDAVELPAVVDVHFKTTGEQLTVDGDPLIFWTEAGTRIPWNERIESTIQLQSADNPNPDFATHCEDLWNNHLVYEPLQGNI